MVIKIIIASSATVCQLDYYPLNFWIIRLVHTMLKSQNTIKMKTTGNHCNYQ